MNIKAKGVRFKKNLNNHGFLFHHNIISYYLFGIGYEYVRRIPCICSACLRKLTSPWNRSQYRSNKDLYKYANQNYVYCPTIGTYNNYKIIHCVDSCTAPE